MVSSQQKGKCWRVLMCNKTKGRETHNIERNNGEKRRENGVV